MHLPWCAETVKFRHTTFVQARELKHITAGVGARPKETDWAAWPSRAYGWRVPNLSR